jgi:hypothetical protein
MQSRSVPDYLSFEYKNNLSGNGQGFGAAQ